MNILFVSNLYPKYEGQSRISKSYALHNFVKYWVKNENILVINLSERYIKNFYIKRKNEKFKEKKFKLDNVTIYNRSVFKIPKLSYYFETYKFKKQINKVLTPDVIVSHLINGDILSYHIAKKENIPLIIGVHNTCLKDISRSNAYKKLFNKYFNFASGIACRSQWIYNKLIDMYPQYKEKAFLAFSGIEKDKIESKKYFNEKIDKINKAIENKNISFITVANLIKRKNVDVVLKTLAKLDISINWHYTIIGDGVERDNLEKLAKDLNISDKVTFKGLLSHEEVYEELKSSNIFILVSKPETLGLVYLEAMAKGNIVIGSIDYGISGIVDNGVNGFLCDPENVDEIKNIIHNILLNYSKEQIQKLVLESYNLILKMTHDNMANQYLDNIKRIIQFNEKNSLKV